MTAITVAAVDGGGNALAFRADQNPDNSITLRSSLELGGAAVSAANPLMPAVASVYSTGLEASHILKASAGVLYGFEAWFNQSGYIMLFDAASVPNDGAVVPRKVWQVNSSQGNTFDKTFSPPLAMAAGAVLVFSSTGPFTKTASAAAQFSAEIA